MDGVHVVPGRCADEPQNVYSWMMLGRPIDGVAEAELIEFWKISSRHIVKITK